MLNFMNSDNYRLVPEEDSQRDELNNLFMDFGMKLTGNIGKIMYAKRCFVRNGTGMHIVLSGSKGPISVLIINGEFVQNRITTRGTNMDWILIPCPVGSMAIIGNKEESLVEVENAISANIKWPCFH